MSKVLLLRQRHGDFYMRNVKRVAMMLPLFERDGGKGYTHRVRAAEQHYIDNKLSHTSVTFWCGGGGLLAPNGSLMKRYQKSRVCSEPSLGRVVCATCEARAIGAGQVGAGKINGCFVKFKPHVDFMPRPATKNGVSQ